MVVVGEVAVAVEVANGGVVLVGVVDGGVVVVGVVGAVRDGGGVGVGVAVDSGTEPPCTFPATATS